MEFKKGDKVVITGNRKPNEFGIHHYYKLEEECIVQNKSTNKDYESYNLRNKEGMPQEVQVEHFKLVDAPFKVGDYVKVKKYYTHNFKDGQICTIDALPNNAGNNHGAYRLKARPGEWKTAGFSTYFPEIQVVNSEHFEKIDVNSLNLDNMQTQIVTIVKDTVDSLVKINGQFTTLELKNELRKNSPYIRWYQHSTADGVKGVSEYVAEMVANGQLFVIDDNGTYRTYSNQPKAIKAVTPTKVVKQATLATGGALNPQQRAWVTRRAKQGKTTTPNTRQQLIDALGKAGGKFITVSFVKKTTGDDRTINGKVKSINGNIVIIDEASKSKQGVNATRSFDVNTVKTARVNGNLYSL